MVGDVGAVRNAQALGLDTISFESTAASVLTALQQVEPVRPGHLAAAPGTQPGPKGLRPVPERPAGAERPVDSRLFQRKGAAAQHELHSAQTPPGAGRAAGAPRADPSNPQDRQPVLHRCHRSKPQHQARLFPDQRDPAGRQAPGIARHTGGDRRRRRPAAVPAAQKRICQTGLRPLRSSAQPQRCRTDLGRSGHGTGGAGPLLLPQQHPDRLPAGVHRVRLPHPAGVGRLYQF